MSKLFQCSSITGLLWLVSVAVLSEASAPTGYVIKPRLARDFVDALVQLRRFLSDRYSAEQRCQRQAVVLATMDNASINQFEIADVAVARKEEIAKQFNQINVEKLRNLYIAATRQYLEQQHVDNSLIELVGCLKSGYRNRDARVRSFLNDRELNTLVEQFQAISKQPLSLLVDSNNPQTGLDLYQFRDSIKKTVNNWIGDDHERFNRLFDQQPVQVPQQPVNEQPHISASAEMAHNDLPLPPELGPTRVQVDPARVGAGSAIAIAATGPLKRPPADQEFLKAAEPAENDEDQEYLETVFGSLMAVYESLPEQAQLADRCQAYNRIIAANRQQIFNDKFVDQLIRQVSARVLKQGPRRGVFRPDKKTREDILFIVKMFDPLRAGPEVWLDLNECLAKWIKLDQSVARYLNSREHVALVQRVNAQFEDESVLAYAQAGATVY